MASWEILLRVFGAVGLYGVVHSWLASPAVKAWVARQWRWGGGTYRLFYNLFATLTLLPVLALPMVSPDRPLYRIPWPGAAGALALQGAGGLLVLDALRRTGLKAFLGLEDPEAHTRFQAHGPYRWTRHPVYFGSLLFLWATPWMTRNQAFLYAALSLYLLVGTQIEERRLLRQWGEPYRTYRGQVPDWDFLLTLAGMGFAALMAHLY